MSQQGNKSQTVKDAEAFMKATNKMLSRLVKGFNQEALKHIPKEDLEKVMGTMGDVSEQLKGAHPELARQIGDLKKTINNLK